MVDFIRLDLFMASTTLSVMIFTLVIDNMMKLKWVVFQKGISTYTRRTFIEMSRVY